jgi:hypothetical protein
MCIRDRFQGEPTSTQVKLAEEFNDFTADKYKVRAIKRRTFVDHVKKIIEMKKLSLEQVEFFNSCKQETQQDGYIPTSKKAKRK